MTRRILVKTAAARCGILVDVEPATPHKCVLRRAVPSVACMVMLAIGLGGLGAARADNPVLAPKSTIAVKKETARFAESALTAAQTSAPVRSKTPSWGTPAGAPNMAETTTSKRGNSSSVTTPQLVEMNLPWDQMTPDQQIRWLHETVRLLQSQLAAANARLAADEDHLAHHTHTYLGPHFYITTARSVLNELNSATNPGIVWMSPQILEHPTGPATFPAP